MQIIRHTIQTHTNVSSFFLHMPTSSFSLLDSNTSDRIAACTTIISSSLFLQRMDKWSVLAAYTVIKSFTDLHALHNKHKHI